ncbi:parafibromin-like [Stegodyphus dumicola]|uniref:parafibromin-like n=1 Tax=Stegodyphus dumicola TaxID=202533 RepID=UPI0015AC1B73|nr:parafibromin-like [Stegodyphus dumicola]
MVDPLSILREYNVNKKPITERNNQIIFGEYSWPKTVETNYLELWRKKAAIKKYYTLESLLFFLKNAHLFHPEYVRKAEAENIPAVRRPDRKDY